LTVLKGLNELRTGDVSRDAAIGQARYGIRHVSLGVENASGDFVRCHPRPSRARYACSAFSSTIPSALDYHRLVLCMA
jgi:hypothetical protein